MTQQERLRYLLEGLVAEYKEKHNEYIDIPVSEKEQFTLFRALCNIRPAGAMPLEWMKIEDEYLITLAREKGIVTINDMEEREPQIYLWQGDITRLSVEMQPIINCSDVLLQIISVLITLFIPFLVLSFVWNVQE